MNQLGSVLVAVCLAGPAPALAQAVPPPPSPSPDDLAAVQREHQRELDFCLVRERSLHPGAAGTVVIDFVLTATDDGARATEATVLSTSFTLAGAVAPECVRAAVMRWRFPAPSDPSRHQVMTFVLGMESAPTPADTRPTPPAVAAPARARVSWTMHPRLFGDEAVAAAVGAELDRREADLVACFSDAALAEAPSGVADVQLQLHVPGNGDLGRDDVSVLSSTWPDTARLVRCLAPHVARVELRGVSEPRDVVWWVQIAWP
jgi:hypothetical protein